MTAPSYESPVFSAWRASSRADWQRYVEHQFVRELADGSLPGKAFVHYLIQDYVFLMHFARAWSLVVVKARTITEMRIAAATVNALVNDEMSLHVATCARYGISEAELGAARETSANLAYTRFVLDAGYSGDLLDLLAALAPCVFGYGEIGWRLARQKVAGNPYQEWIDTYAGTEYQQVCVSVGGLLEAATADRLGLDPQSSPRWPQLTETFRQATALECDFWQMGLTAQESLNRG